MVKHLPAMQESWVQSLGWEDPRRREWHDWVTKQTQTPSPDTYRVWWDSRLLPEWSTQPSSESEEVAQEHRSPGVVPSDRWLAARWRRCCHTHTLIHTWAPLHWQLFVSTCRCARPGWAQHGRSAGTSHRQGSSHGSPWGAGPAGGHSASGDPAHSPAGHPAEAGCTTGGMRDRSETNTHAQPHTQPYTQPHTHTHTQSRTHSYTTTHTTTQPHTQPYTQSHTHSHTQPHTHLYTVMYTLIHNHTHTQTQSRTHSYTTTQSHTHSYTHTHTQPHTQTQTFPDTASVLLKNTSVSYLFIHSDRSLFN